MNNERNQKLQEVNIPGVMNRGQRFAEAEHAKNVGGTLKRIAVYFVREKVTVVFMLAVVVFGTLCGILAPSLQSKAIDIIAGERTGNIYHTIVFMLTMYLLYSVSALLQGFLSAGLSQSVVKRMRQELFGKIIDLPIQYLDTHSYGDVMSRMTNDIENISTTVSQSLPSLFSGIPTQYYSLSLIGFLLRHNGLYSFGCELSFFNIILIRIVWSCDGVQSFRSISSTKSR